MRVEQLHKHVLFDGISSKLRMYKTSAIGMLFEVFLCQIQQFKRMTITSNSIKHYQFSSCLRTYSLVKTSIRYPRTAQIASCDVRVPSRCSRHGNRITPTSIAACARKQGVIGRFDGEKRACNSLERQKVVSTKSISAMIASGVSA